MSTRNEFVVDAFLMGYPWKTHSRNLSCDPQTDTLKSYNAVIAFRLNGTIHVNGATKKLSGSSWSKTTAGHINLLIRKAKAFATDIEVSRPEHFSHLYQDHQLTRAATQAYMNSRKAQQ